MTDDTHSSDSLEREESLYPISPRWFKIGFYLFWLVWIGYILAETTTFGGSQDWLFPYVIGVPIALMLLLKLFVVVKPGYAQRFTPDSEDDDPADDELDQRMKEASESAMSDRTTRERQKVELVMIGWVIVLPVMMFYLGITNALILYVFALTWYFVRRVRTAVLVTVVVMAAIYILFLQILGITFWQGVFDLPDPFLVLHEYL